MSITSPVLLAEARRFIADLKQNRRMNQSWQAMVNQLQSEEKAARDAGKSEDAIHQLVGQGFQAMDNFIAEQGYDTSTISVLGFIKSPLYQEWIGITKPDEAARKFVQALLTDSELADGWQKLVSRVGAKQATADDLDAFLKAHSFACSYTQVNGAFQEMRDHNVTYWTGAYTTVQAVNGGASSEGPIVTLSNRRAASMGLLQVNQTIIDDSAHLRYENGVLSWSSTPAVAFSGSITFSTITQKAPATGNYVGNLFDGQLRFERDEMASGRKAGDQVSLTGRLNTVSDQDPRTPPAAAEKFNKFPQWVTYLVNGLMIVQLLVSLGKKYKGFKAFSSDAKNPDYDAKVDGAQQDLDKSIDEVGEKRSPFENPEALDGSSLQKYLRARAEESFGEAEKRYEKEFKSAEVSDNAFDEQGGREADPENEGWGRDIEGLGSSGGIEIPDL